MSVHETGQAEHLDVTTREVRAIAAQLIRAADDYGSGDARAGHGDSWRLDRDLLAAEVALREIRRANAAWRQRAELALAEAEADAYHVS